MFTLVLGETGVIEDEQCFRSVLLQFEFDDRLRPFLPIRNAPSLYDSLIRDKLDVASLDHASEASERTAFFRADFRRNAAGRLAELLAAKERIIYESGARLEGNFLVNRRGHRLSTSL